jgi:hypothetical protein
MIDEDLDRLHDELRGLDGGYGVRFDQEIGKPIEIVQRAGGIAQLRQDFALGFRVLRPRTRALRYACTSEAGNALPDVTASVRAACASATNSARNFAATAASRIASTMKA